MRKIGMTREQAVDATSEIVVSCLEGLNCDFTNRVDNDLDLEGVIEFSASINIPFDLFAGKDLSGKNLVIYYYESKDAVDNCDGDLGRLDWNDCTYVIE